MKVGIQAIGSIYMDPDHPDIDRDFKNIKAAGFDTVDFNLEIFLDWNSIASLNGDCFYDRSMDELKTFFRPFVDACRNNGLEFSQMHAPFYLYIKDDEKRRHFIEIEKKSVELAAWMGSPYVVVHPFIMRRDFGRKAEWEANLAFYRELMPIAKEHHIKICLENMFETYHEHICDAICSDPGEAVRLIETLNAEAGEECFAFCFDMGHATLLGRDIYDFVTVLGSHLQILHLHDNDGIHDLHNLPFVFTRTWGPGMGDWDGLIKGLKEIRYSGVLNFETCAALFAFPPQLHQDVRTFICRIGHYIADSIEK